MIEELANRLRKRQKHLRKWARRRGITCYRLYEKDLPDQPLIIDWYDGDVVLWTLQRKRNETEEQDIEWVNDVCETAASALAVEDRQLFLKQRKRQRGKQQYEKYGRDHYVKTVREGDLLFEINLSDYLDTGLFLDHRPLRRRIHEESADKRVLNCFAYTGSFSCAAAAGGAAAVCTIDLSNTYLDWFRRNLSLNKLNPDAHDIRRSDCLEALREMAASPWRYDIIICDPPTFSNSKKTDNDFVVQERHVDLIQSCMRCLASDGTLFFSTNFRSFKLDQELQEQFQIRDISAATIPEDFRNQRIHYCWEISHRQ